MKNAEILERIQISPAFLSVDVNSDQNGDWVAMKDYERCLVLYMQPAGTAGDDVSIKLQQATTNAGGSAKALAAIKKLWYKKGSGGGLPADQWTEEEATTATDDWDTGSGPTGATSDLELDDQQALVAVEIKKEDLDVDNDFDHIRLQIEGDDFSNSLTASALYIFLDPNYADSPANMRGVQ